MFEDYVRHQEESNQYFSRAIYYHDIRRNRWLQFSVVVAVRWFRRLSTHYCATSRGQWGTT